MNTLIRVRGWITDSTVIHPQSKITEPDKIHRLRIHPQDSFILFKLEDAIKQLKEEYEMQPRNPEEFINTEQKDRVIDGCQIVLESLYPPKLEGELKGIERDDELQGRFVQAVGHLRILKDGNVFLSVHILEPAYLDDFNPIQ